MASKQPLIEFWGHCSIMFKLKATSESAAERKARDSIRSIYKDVKLTQKAIDYLEWPDKEM